MTTGIPWTDEVWNMVTGCTPVSDGCAKCYAASMAKRWQKSPNDKIAHKYRNGFKPTIHFGELGKPLSWKKPRRIFAPSMGDLFHPDIPDQFIHLVFEMMCWADQHTYLVLSKRPERLDELGLAHCYDHLRNVWFGVSIENEDQMARLDRLYGSTDFAFGGRFVSFEPLLGPIADIGDDLRYADWVIVGGENGPGARPMNPRWARDIRDMCLEKKIPFFFKGWGGSNKDMTIEGKIHQEFPKMLHKGDK